MVFPSPFSIGGAIEGAWTRSHSAPGCGRIGACTQKWKNECVSVNGRVDGVIW